MIDPTINYGAWIRALIDKRDDINVVYEFFPMINHIYMHIIDTGQIPPDINTNLDSYLEVMGTKFFPSCINWKDPIYDAVTFIYNLLMLLLSVIMYLIEFDRNMASIYLSALQKIVDCSIFKHRIISVYQNQIESQINSMCFFQKVLSIMKSLHSYDQNIKNIWISIINIQKMLKIESYLESAIECIEDFLLEISNNNIKSIDNSLIEMAFSTFLDSVHDKSSHMDKWCKLFISFIQIESIEKQTIGFESLKKIYKKYPSHIISQIDISKLPMIIENNMNPYLFFTTSYFFEFLSINDLMTLDLFTIIWNKKKFYQNNDLYKFVDLVIALVSCCNDSIICSLLPIINTDSKTDISIFVKITTKLFINNPSSLVLESLFQQLLKEILSLPFDEVFLKIFYELICIMGKHSNVIDFGISSQAELNQTTFFSLLIFFFKDNYQISSELASSLFYRAIETINQHQQDFLSIAKFLAELFMTNGFEIDINQVTLLFDQLISKFDIGNALLEDIIKSKAIRFDVIQYTLQKYLFDPNSKEYDKYIKLYYIKQVNNCLNNYVDYCIIWNEINNSKLPNTALNHFCEIMQILISLGANIGIQYASILNYWINHYSKSPLKYIELLGKFLFVLDLDLDPMSYNIYPHRMFQKSSNVLVRLYTNDTFVQSHIFNNQQKFSAVISRLSFFHNQQNGLFELYFDDKLINKDILIKHLSKDNEINIRYTVKDCNQLPIGRPLLSKLVFFSPIIDIIESYFLDGKTIGIFDMSFLPVTNNIFIIYDSLQSWNKEAFSNFFPDRDLFFSYIFDILSSDSQDVLLNLVNNSNFFLEICEMISVFSTDLVSKLIFLYFPIIEKISLNHSSMLFSVLISKEYLISDNEDIINGIQDFLLKLIEYSERRVLIGLRNSILKEIINHSEQKFLSSLELFSCFEGFFDCLNQIFCFGDKIKVNLILQKLSGFITSYEPSLFSWLLEIKGIESASNISYVLKILIRLRQSFDEEILLRVQSYSLSIPTKHWFETNDFSSLICYFEFCSQYGICIDDFLRNYDFSLLKDLMKIEYFNYDLSVNGIGLLNLGCTCYLNSVMQLLFSIDYLKELLMSYNGNDSFHQSFSKLFLRMQYSQFNPISTKDFASNIIGWDGQKLNPKIQQDAYEFLIFIIDKLESIIPTETFSTLFIGSIITEITSNQENFFSSYSERCNSISLNVEGMACLSESLISYYSTTYLSGKNQYTIERSKKKIDAESRNKFGKLPNCLIIHLLRFKYNVATGNRSKVESFFSFPKTINFGEIVTNGNDLGVYSLKGMILHRGNTESGHYYSIVYHNDRWTCFNDNDVSILQEEEAFAEAFGGYNKSSAYILLYQKMDSVIDIITKPDDCIINSIKDENIIIKYRLIYSSQSYQKMICDSSLFLKGDSFDVIIHYFLRVIPLAKYCDIQMFFKTIRSLFIERPQSQGVFLRSMLDVVYIMYLSEIDNSLFILTIIQLLELISIDSFNFDFINIAYRSLMNEYTDGKIHPLHSILFLIIKKSRWNIENNEIFIKEIINLYMNIVNLFYKTTDHTVALNKYNFSSLIDFLNDFKHYINNSELPFIYQLCNNVIFPSSLYNYCTFFNDNDFSPFYKMLQNKEINISPQGCCLVFMIYESEKFNEALEYLMSNYNHYFIFQSFLLLFEFNKEYFEQIFHSINIWLVSFLINNNEYLMYETSKLLYRFKDERLPNIEGTIISDILMDLFSKKIDFITNILHHYSFSYFLDVLSFLVLDKYNDRLIHILRVINQSKNIRLVTKLLKIYFENEIYLNDECIDEFIYFINDSSVSQKYFLHLVNHLQYCNLTDNSLRVFLRSICFQPHSFYIKDPDVLYSYILEMCHIKAHIIHEYLSEQMNKLLENNFSLMVLVLRELNESYPVFFYIKNYFSNPQYISIDETIKNAHKINSNRMVDIKTITKFLNMDIKQESRDLIWDLIFSSGADYYTVKTLVNAPQNANYLSKLISKSSNCELASDMIEYMCLSKSALKTGINWLYNNKESVILSEFIIYQMFGLELDRTCEAEFELFVNIMNTILAESTFKIYINILIQRVLRSLGFLLGCINENELLLSNKTHFETMLIHAKVVRQYSVNVELEKLSNEIKNTIERKKWSLENPIMNDLYQFSLLF